MGLKALCLQSAKRKRLTDERPTARIFIHCIVLNILNSDSIDDPAASGMSIESIGRFVSEGIASLYSMGASLFGAAKQMLSAALSTLKTLLTKFIAGVSAALLALKAAVASAVAAVLAAANSAWLVLSGVIASAKAALSAAVEFAKQTLSNLVAEVKLAVSELMKSASQLLSKVDPEVVMAIIQGVSILMKAVVPMADHLISAAQSEAISTFAEEMIKVAPFLWKIINLFV